MEQVFGVNNKRINFLIHVLVPHIHTDLSSSEYTNKNEDSNCLRLKSPVWPKML